MLDSNVARDNGSRMGRPPLGVKPTTVRLPLEVFDRIEAVAGKNQTAAFIREAVDRELARRERVTSAEPPVSR